MKDIVTVFKELYDTNSIKEKEKILEANKLNGQLKRLLKLNLDPYTMFHIKKIPEYVPNQLGKQGTENYKAFLQLTSDLSNREITGNEAKEAVRTFFMESHNIEAPLYETILVKGACGVGSTTVNKVWPTLIPEFKVMLAPSKLPNLTQIKYPAIVQPKLDGYRCIYKEGMLWSRTGMPFGNENLASHFKKLFDINEYVIDGELYVEGKDFNSLQKTLNNYKAPLPKDLKLIAYDCVPLKDWDAQFCKIAYKERLTLLRNVLSLIGNYKKVIDIASDEVQGADEVVELYKKYLKKGYEGVMIKDINGLYQWKRVTIRSGEMLKLKPFVTADLTVTGVYDGEGEFSGTLGGIIVDFNGNAVRCGSGFDFATRDTVSKNPNSYIGKTAEIKYFEETEDGSLRFPTFVRWRDDK